MCVPALITFSFSLCIHSHLVAVADILAEAVVHLASVVGKAEPEEVDWCHLEAAAAVDPVEAEEEGAEQQKESEKGHQEEEDSHHTKKPA